MFSSVYQRRLFITLLLMAISAPAVAYFGLAAMRNIRTSPALWVPDTFQKRREYDWFERTFETNDSVIISWDNCTLDDPRLADLYQALHEPDDSEDGLLIRKYVGRVFTGKTLLDAMQAYPLELPENIARERLAEAIIGPPRETTIFADSGSQTLSGTQWAIGGGEDSSVKSVGQSLVFARSSNDSDTAASVATTIETKDFKEVTVAIRLANPIEPDGNVPPIVVEYALDDAEEHERFELDDQLRDPKEFLFRLRDDIPPNSQLKLRIAADFEEHDAVKIDHLEVTGISPGITCCVVLLSDLGVGERKKTVPLLMRTAEEKAGVPSDEQKVVGPVYDAYSIDVESIKSMRTFIVPSMFIVICLCRFCLRSWAYTLLVFIVAVFGELLTLALVYTGDELFDFGPMNAVLIVMPPLVMVLTVSAAVHLVNYYHDEVRRLGVEGAPRKALQNGLMPCALATGTTAIGLLSLLLSDIIPVKLFGVYATCGIASTLVLLVLTLPGAQERWPVPAREGRESIFKDLSGVSNFVCRFPVIVGLLCLALMLTCGYGLQYMRTSVNVRSLFTPDSRILNDYQWFEKHIGPMTPVEVVLHFEPESDLDELERLEVVDQMQRAVSSIEEIHGTMSAATFYRSIPRRFSQRAGMARRLKRDVQEFDNINYTAIFDQFALLAPGETIRLEGFDAGEYEYVTVEGYTGVAAAPEEEEGWSETTWPERRHFAFVFGGDEVRVFLDGKRSDKGPNLPAIEIAGDGGITLANGLSDEYLALDDLTVWQGARYWREFTPSARWDRDEETIALWHFEDTEEDVIPDDLGLHTVSLSESQKAKRRYNEEHWRIGGRVAAIGDPNKPELDYGEFLAEIQQQIDPRLWAIHYMQQNVREMLQGQNREQLAKSKVLLIGVPPAAIPTPDAEGGPSEERGEDESQPTRSQDPLAGLTFGSPQAKSAAIFAHQLSKLLNVRGINLGNITAIDVGQSPTDAQRTDAALIVYIRDIASFPWKQAQALDVDTVDARLHPVILDPENPIDTRIVSATYTGVMPLAYEVQNALLNDLIKSFLSAVALVSVVMIVLQRSPVAGIVAMLPNVFPMVLLFGITSGLGMAIDIGTVMTASVALGIAVDDTLHFLTWFNREHSDTGDHQAGVKLAFRHCAKAMLQTTMICSLGLLVYSFSWFMPTRRFSWMMVSLLMAAVLGDLVFLPAILAGPIGKLFPKRKLIGDPLAADSVQDQAAQDSRPEAV